MNSQEYNIIIITLSILCVISVFYTVNAGPAVSRYFNMSTTASLSNESKKLRKCKDDLKNANFNYKCTLEEAVKHAFFNTKIPESGFHAKRSENFQYRYSAYLMDNLGKAINFNENILYPYDWYIKQHNIISDKVNMNEILDNQFFTIIDKYKLNKQFKLDAYYNMNIPINEIFLQRIRHSNLDFNFFCLFMFVLENEESNKDFKLFMHHVWDNAIITFPENLKNPSGYCNLEETYTDYTLPVDD